MKPPITWAVDERPAPKLVTCHDCGCLRYSGPGPHSPRWLDGRQVDCVGREVRALVLTATGEVRP